jgi:hypothetical protein
VTIPLIKLGFSALLGVAMNTSYRREIAPTLSDFNVVLAHGQECIRPLKKVNLNLHKRDGSSVVGTNFSQPGLEVRVIDATLSVENSTAEATGVNLSTNHDGDDNQFHCGNILLEATVIVKQFFN